MNSPRHHAFLMPCPSDTPRFDHFSNIRWEAPLNVVFSVLLFHLFSPSYFSFKLCCSLRVTNVTALQICTAGVDTGWTAVTMCTVSNGSHTVGP
jgi:hypothetical protein